MSTHLKILSPICTPSNWWGRFRGWLQLTFCLRNPQVCCYYEYFTGPDCIGGSVNMYKIYDSAFYNFHCDARYLQHIQGENWLSYCRLYAKCQSSAAFQDVQGFWSTKNNINVFCLVIYVQIAAKTAQHSNIIAHLKRNCEPRETKRLLMRNNYLPN